MSRLIDADKLRKTIHTHQYRLATVNNSIEYGMFTIGIDRAIDEQPTVDAEPVRHGHWELVDDENHIEAIYMCSACRNNEAWGEVEKTRYCSWCGAKME